MRFHLFIVIAITLLLGGCTLPGTQSEGSAGEGVVQYSGSGFSISLPKGWTTETTKTLPTPRKGNLILTVVSPDVRYGFSNNIIIMADTLETPMTSKKYSEMNQIQTTRNYLEYTKISDESIIFPDDDEGVVYAFEARYNTTTPKQKFIQTAKVCGTQVYLIHAAIALDKNTDNYINLFKTFECQ